MSYIKKTGKCNSIKGSCPNKNLNNLECKTFGIYIDGHKPHDYFHNRVGGNGQI